METDETPLDFGMRIADISRPVRESVFYALVTFLGDRVYQAHHGLAMAVHNGSFEIWETPCSTF